MIIVGTTVDVVDNTGIIKARCIKIYGDTKKKYATIGDYILVVVETYTVKRGMLLDEKKKNRFLKGRQHRAIVLRSQCNYLRNNGVFIRFSDNAIILVNKRKLPLSKKVKGPMLYELYEKYTAIGILGRWLI